MLVYQRVYIIMQLWSSDLGRWNMSAETKEYSDLYKVFPHLKLIFGRAYSVDIDWIHL